MSLCFAPWRSRVCGRFWRAARHSCRESASWPGRCPAPRGSIVWLEGLGLVAKCLTPGVCGGWGWPGWRIAMLTCIPDS